MQPITRRHWLAAVSPLLAAPVLAQDAQPIARRNASNATPDLYRAIANFWEPHEREIVDSLKVRAGMQVLDAGCGRGDHLVLFARNARVTGLDLKESSLDLARERLRAAGRLDRATLQAGDIFKMPFAPQSFDLVWSSHVFHGLRDLPEAAASIRRAIKPGGRFVLRENRITASLLPDDLGIGEPGLESRLNRAFEAWLRKDRAERGRYPHGWSHLLIAAGFRDVHARCFLHQVAPLFTDAQKQYLHYWLDRKREIEGVLLADIETLNRLVDPAGPHYFLKRDDLIFAAVSSIYTGVA
ncbi:MAG: class I SAM-dependent methyltransferase [Acidobacteria bacterium]|nr:class I SAM-dependent methyltransferase [Acidobacteriota bacterium]